MPEKRKIVGVRKDSDGDITHVKFAGNERVTPIDRAIPIAKRGEIDRVHAVKDHHLRTNRDGSIKNNLDELPEV